MTEIALPEIEGREAFEHQPIAFERRLVEAIEHLELRNLLRVDAVMRA